MTAPRKARMGVAVEVGPSDRQAGTLGLSSSPQSTLLLREVTAAVAGEGALTGHQLPGAVLELGFLAGHSICPPGTGQGQAEALAERGLPLPVRGLS